MRFCNYVIVSLVFFVVVVVVWVCVFFVCVCVFFVVFFLCVCCCFLPFNSSRIMLFIYKRQQDIRILFSRQRVLFDENVEG